MDPLAAIFVALDRIELRRTPFPRTLENDAVHVSGRKNEPSLTRLYLNKLVGINVIIHVFPRTRPDWRLFCETSYSGRAHNGRKKARHRNAISQLTADDWAQHGISRNGQSGARKARTEARNEIGATTAARAPASLSFSVDATTKDGPERKMAQSALTFCRPVRPLVLSLPTTHAVFFYIFEKAPARQTTGQSFERYARVFSCSSRRSAYAHAGKCPRHFE